MNYYYVQPGYCAAQNAKTVATFSHYFGQLPLPVVDDALGIINISYPYSKIRAGDHLGYQVEGVLSHENSAYSCSFCPYHQIPGLNIPENFQVGGFRYVHLPMYGPCFNGELSTRINCVQHQLLYPPEFVGEYFYPEQRNITDNTVQYLPVHSFLKTNLNIDVYGSIKNPTDYGIGKGYVKLHLDGMVFQSSGNNEAGDILKTEFRKDYVDTSDGLEQWLKWGQHFCDPSCHRNSERFVVQIRESDFKNKSISLFFLSIKNFQGEYSKMVKCKKCPASQASYIWRLGFNLMNYYFQANECHPWFGSIPSLIYVPGTTIDKPSTWEFNVTTVTHSIDTDGVVSPTLASKYEESIQCAVNTYNDICAHTIKYWKNTADLEGKAACKPCPVGYHTNGKNGSWFCIPPAGNLMVNRNLLLSIVDSENNNQSLLWSRRDYLAYEFECGWMPSQCRQCSNSTGTAEMLPDEFNQQMILKHVLSIEKCKSGFYCPDPLKDNITCPQDFPWSPPGSSSIQNCTCKRGTYLNSITKICSECGDRTQCQTGQFLQGWYNCKYRDGATSGGVCSPCGNKPQQYSSYTGSYGMEVVQSEVVTGICSFNCLNGYKISAGSTSVPTCFKLYSCAALEPRTDGSGNILYSGNLYNLMDKFSAIPGSTDSCTVSSELTNGFNVQSSWETSSSLCSNANPSNCNNTNPCTVSVEASFYRNFECQPCPPPPMNGHYTTEAIRGNTIKGQRDKLCSIECDVPYYANSSKCENCSALDSRYCRPGYRVRGQGCLSDPTPFSSNISENCYQCNIFSVQPGSYIYYGSDGVCSIQTCSAASVPDGFYRSSICGGTNPGSISRCTSTTDCSYGQYLHGSCSQATTGICTNCTTHKPGYYMGVFGGCGTITDSTWTQCSSPYYCAGNGSMTLCPNSKLSSTGAASSLACFCPAGTTEDNLGLCVQFQCPGSVLSLFGPGVGNQSSYYMELNSVFRTTCFPCDSNLTGAIVSRSFSIGNGGVGFGSCRCPTDMYGMINTSARSISCVPCTSSLASCGSASFNVASDTCWTGNNRDSASTCTCILPPFTTKRSSGACNYDFCESPFEKKSITTSTSASEQLLGSALYIIKSDSKNGWNSLFPTNILDNNLHMPPGNVVIDFNIAKLKVTSNKGVDYALDNIQYVLWTIKDPSYRFAIWTSPLNPSGLLSGVQGYNSYYSNSKPWSPICNSLSEYTFEDMAVAKWPFGQTTSKALGGVSSSTIVAALLKHTPSGGTVSFSLYLNLLSVEPSFNAKWALDGACGTSDSRPPILINGLSSGYIIHSLSHVYVVSSGQAFYVAYNIPSLRGCGVMAVSVTDSGTSNGAGNRVIDLTSVGGRQITALAIVANPSSGSGVLMYVAFDNLKDRIRLIKWSASTTESRDLLAGTESDELFFSVNSDTLSISVLWSNSLPIFLANARPTSSNVPSIYTADNIQRTFTKVQGMTHSTQPSMGPLGVELETSGHGLMIASSGSNIFYISTSRCTPSLVDQNIPRYWDGSTCVDHVCVRPRSCTASDGSQTWDPSSLRCVCSPGYYNSDASGGLSCFPCEAKITLDGISGFFCLNNTKIGCPNNLPNNIVKAKSPADCSCADGYYFSDSAGACMICQIGKWCPNKWNMFDCPGDAGIQTGGGGAIYPTSCTCSTGHVGPNCLLCPEGKVCLSQSSSSTSNLVKNVALQLNVNLYDTTRQLTAQIIENVICEDILVNNLYTIFLNGGLYYLMIPDLLRLRYFCKFIPASYHSNSSFVIMIQLNNADDAGNDVGTSMRMALSLYNSSYMTISKISSTSVINSIVNNTEAICPAGKVPNDARALCICAAGYASSSTLLCTQCISGFYKANSGFGTCISCPIGSTSKSASSFCTKIIDGTVATQNAVNDNNLPIIAGGVIGGVILVGLLIFGMARITSSN
jgi:hypothetical protein